MADGRAAVGSPLTYEDFFVLNTHVDAVAALWGKVDLTQPSLHKAFPPGCSSFSVWGDASADGGLICGSNIDWMEFSTDEENNLRRPVVLIAEPEDGFPFIALSFPGLIACCQGMNAKGAVFSQKTSTSVHASLKGLGEFFQCRELLHTGFWQTLWDAPSAGGRPSKGWSSPGRVTR